MEFRIRGKRISLWWLVVIFIVLIGVSQRGCGSGYKVYQDARKYKAGNFAYSAADIESVQINWVGADIKVIQKDGGTLHVKESDRGLNNSQKMHWSIENGTLVIQYTKSGYRGRIPGHTKDLTVEVPAGIDLEINSVSGDIKLEGSQQYGKVDINSVSGNVEAGSIAASKAELTTISGECKIGSLSMDKIDIKTTSGDIRAGIADCSKADLHTVSGDVELFSFPSGGAEIKYASASGSLDAQGYESKDKVVTIGAGTCKVTVETVSGDLEIR